MIYIYNIGTLAILSENATLLSENYSNCKCCGIHMLIVFICTATTTTKKLRTKVKLDQISHRTQKWTGQNYWHHVKTFQACDQSWSSLYAEYTSCVGPPKHQGARLCSQRGIRLVSFLKLASGYENMNDQYFNAVSCHPLYVKNHSNHVTWTSYSLLHETQKKNEPRKRCCFSSARERDSRWSEMRTNVFHPFFHPILLGERTVDRWDKSRAFW